MLYSLGIKYMADVHKCLMPKRVGSSYNIAYMNDLKTGTPVYFNVSKSGGWDMCMAAWKSEVVAWQKESPEVVWLVIEHCSKSMRDRLCTVATYPDLLKRNDTIGLLKLIKDISLNRESKAGAPVASNVTGTN